MSTQNVSAKDLFVLGILSIRPTYGHEIMRALAESRADLWVELSEKHVYYILRKLEQAGFVSVEVRSDGAGPSRRVFSATPTGICEFERLVRADRLIESTPYSDFDIVFGMLVYSDRLTDDEKTAVLRRRISHLEEVIAEASAARGKAASNSAPNFAARVFDRLVLVAEVERAWLEDVLGEIGANGWPQSPLAAGDAGRLDS